MIFLLRTPTLTAIKPWFPAGSLPASATRTWFDLITRINRAVPGLFQKWMVRWIYDRGEDHTFRVAYQANSVSRLAALAGAAGLRLRTLDTVSDPTYLAFNEPLFWLSVGLEGLTPSANFVHLVGDFAKSAEPFADSSPGAP